MPSIIENIDRKLDKGQVRDRFGICCPDCEESEGFSVHASASIETYLKYAESVNFNGCCLNIYTSSQDDFAKWADFSGGAIYNEETGTWEAQPPYELEIISGNYLLTTTGETACVDNNFYSCITQISGLCSDFSGIAQKGIIEYNTLSGKSIICELKDFIVANLSSPIEIEEFLDRFLDKGMVSSCIEDEINISSVETWLKYAEAMGLTGGFGGPVPE